MNSLNRFVLIKRLWRPLLWFAFVLISFTSAIAQERPPRPIKVTVSNAQHLNFGTIIPVSLGGKFMVYYDDSSIVTSGSILQLHSYNCKAAVFIVDAEPGVLINIDYPVNRPTMSNGKDQLQMQLGMPYIDGRPGFQFITREKLTYVRIGAELTVGDIGVNSPGSYSGTFSVTFNQE